MSNTDPSDVEFQTLKETKRWNRALGDACPHVTSPIGRGIRGQKLEVRHQKSDVSEKISKFELPLQSCVQQLCEIIGGGFADIQDFVVAELGLRNSRGEVR